MFTEETLFISGEGGYHTYRIPALAVSAGDRIMAFAEGRVHGSSDAGEIELLFSTSMDNGQIWTSPRSIVAEAEMTCGNPCPVVDLITGTIWQEHCEGRRESCHPGQSATHGVANFKSR